MHCYPLAKSLPIAALAVLLVIAACTKENPTGPVNTLPPPELHLAILPSVMETGEYIAFKATVENTVLVDPAYRWDFGDGAGLTGAKDTASHAYAVRGTYTVVLRVTDEYSGIDIADTLVVTIGAPVAPQVKIVVTTQRAVMGFPVIFEARVSGNAPPARDMLWDFGDGTPPVKTDASTIEHEYAKQGDYTVRVRMIDRPNDVVVDEDMVQVTVHAAWFEIDIQPDTVYSAPGEEVHFRADITSGPIPGNKTYSWDFGNGSTFSLRDEKNYCTVIRKYHVTTTYRVIVRLESDYVPGAVLAHDTAWVVTR